MKILIVDDSRTMRLMIGRQLKDLGHEVVEAANGEEALECVRGIKDIKMALVDWHMPKMNGLEFVTAVRADEGINDLPIIMVTTQTEMENVQQAVSAGANEYIMKPFAKETIREKMAILGLL